MQQLNLPPYPAQIRNDNDCERIFDLLRNRYVALTPEEWVRQHFTSFLINYKQFPKSLMANEIGITLNGTRRRCDTVVFDKQGKPLVIIEYKAPSVNVTQLTFDQIVRYNMALQARYLIVSNGLSHYCCRINYDNHSYSFLPDIPDYTELVQPIIRTSKRD
ncbi:MAG: type I restriction enzyme HsdR N-terminal domain-containing protein [Muribaculaceae bacterium]|nr:type I restriction enzyme HsdR N-terminal domain-containing protein [Muribaculaceae bacterium]